MSPMTWNGTLVDAAETATHYLHLSAFRCEKCNGPVIAGSLGTRLDDISQETDIRKIGAVCIACRFRPEIIAEQSHWRWKAGPSPGWLHIGCTHRTQTKKAPRILPATAA